MGTWIAAAIAGDIPDLRRFALGLLSDKAATLHSSCYRRNAEQLHEEMATPPAMQWDDRDGEAIW